MYKNVLKILPFEYFQKIIQLLSPKAKKIVARLIVENVVDNGTKIGESSKLDSLLALISPLLVDFEDKKAFGSPKTDSLKKSLVIELDDFVDEQYAVAKMIHLVKAESLIIQYEVRQLFIKASIIAVQEGQGKRNFENTNNWSRCNI